MKNRIRLTESQLHRVIKESVKKVLKESNENKWYTVIETPYVYQEIVIDYNPYEEGFPSASEVERLFEKYSTNDLLKARNYMCDTQLDDSYYEYMSEREARIDMISDILDSEDEKWEEVE